jgi:hypothetical protein
VSAERTPYPSSMLGIEATLSHKGHKGRGCNIAVRIYGVIDTGEKSTNQLFGCTKPLTFGLMARGETSWAT